MSKSKTETSNPTSSENSSSAVGGTPQNTGEKSLLGGYIRKSTFGMGNVTNLVQKVAKTTAFPDWCGEPGEFLKNANKAYEKKQQEKYWTRVAANTEEKYNGKTEKSNIDDYMKVNGLDYDSYYKGLKAEEKELNALNKKVREGKALSSEEEQRREEIYLSRQDRVANGIKLTDATGEDIARYMANEMNEIEKSQKFLDIQRQLKSSNPLDKANGRVTWTKQVMPGGEWDYKERIAKYYTTIDMENRTQYYSEANDGYKYFYDVWSNILYGLVGRKIGFSEEELRSGAGAAQIASDSINYHIESKKDDSNAWELAKKLNEGALGVLSAMTGLILQRKNFGDRLAQSDNNGDQVSIGAGFELFSLSEEITSKNWLDVLTQSEFEIGKTKINILN